MNLVCLLFYLFLYFFCVLRKNSRWPAKSSGKMIFAKSRQLTLQIPCGSKIVKIALSHSVSEINTFFTFYAEIQDGRQKYWENDF